MPYINKDYVYDEVGVTSTQLSTEIVERLIELAEAEVDRHLQTSCYVQQQIEVTEGTGRNYLILKKRPVLSIQALEIGDTTISLDSIKLIEENSEIRLTTESEESYFIRSVDSGNIKVKYLWGWLEESSRYTTTSNAESAGTNVSVEVASGSNFNAKDWVRITGFDGNDEVAQISAISTNTLTITLTQSHEAGSQVKKLEIPGIVKQLTKTIAALAGAKYMMGSTYDFATGYSLPDYQVQKGEPYPAFQKIIDKLTREKERLLELLPGWPVMA